MDITTRQFVLTLLLVLIFDRVALAQTAALAQTSESEIFMVSADTPVVDVGERSAGRNFVRLPSLDYRFDLAANCPADLEAKTISLSIADTRKSLATNEISNEETISVAIRIPAAQIGPIAVDGFCVAAGAQETVRIPAVLSVQASLLCANEEDSRMIYASRSLDVTLSCNTLQNESSRSPQ